MKLAPDVTVKGVMAYASNLSDNPVFLQQMARVAEGQRKAGMPEGEAKTN